MLRGRGRRVVANGPGDERFAGCGSTKRSETGAEVIATACPYCIRMLEDAVSELGVGEQIAVRDVAELLAAVGRVAG